MPHPSTPSADIPSGSGCDTLYTLSDLLKNVEPLHADSEHCTHTTNAAYAHCSESGNTFTGWFRTPWGLARTRQRWCGGAGRDRTDDLRLAKPPLSQLSYSPSCALWSPHPSAFEPMRVVGLVGFEPTTPALSRRCSNRLSYRPDSVCCSRLVTFL